MAVVRTSETSINFTGYDGLQLFLKPIVQDVDLTSFAMVNPNIKQDNSPLTYMSRLKGITRTKHGCVPNYVGVTNLSTRTIERNVIAAAVKACNEDFRDTILNGLTNETASPYYGDPLVTMLTTNFKDGIKYDVHGYAFYGDKTSDNINLQACNGLFGGLANSLSDQLVADHSGDAVPDDVTLINWLNYLRSNSPKALQVLPSNQKVVLMDGSYYTALQSYLAVNTITNGFLVKQDAIGLDTDIYFYGSKIIPMWNWAEYEGRGMGGSNKLVYTALKNIVIGTDLTNENALLRTYVSEDLELKIHSEFTLGVQVYFPEWYAWQN